MAWSFGDSLDLYTNIADMFPTYWDSSPQQNSLSFVAGRFSGSRALQNAGGAGQMVKSSGVNDAIHHFVLSFQQTAAISGTTVGVYFELQDGATTQCTVCFRSDGAIILQSGLGGANLAVYTGAVTLANTWYAFEIEVVIHNTAGSFTVRKNGNNVNDFTLGSLNTRAGTANNYANRITAFRQQSPVNAQVVDDFFWRSDASSVAWMGDIRCYTRMPASDQSVQFSRTSTGVLTQTVPTSAPSGLAGSGLAVYTAFVAPYSGTVTSVGVSISTLGNAVNMKCAIYADNGSGLQPSTILASATAPVNPVVSGTNTFTFTGVNIVKGVQYWIGACSDGTSHSFTSSTSGSSAGATGASSYAAFPQATPVVSTNQKTAQMSWTYTATPANWQAVSEAQQDGTASYVYDSNPGDADFYGVGAIASTPTTVFATTVRAYAQKSDAGIRTLAAQIKSGGTTLASPTLVLTTSGWQWAWRTDIVDPNTGSAWTPAGVNNAQIGPKVVA